MASQLGSRRGPSWRNACAVAYIEEHSVDGRVKVREWPVERMTAKSNLVANIRSKPEYRQDNWRGAGLAKVVVLLARQKLLQLQQAADDFMHSEYGESLCQS